MRLIKRKECLFFLLFVFLIFGIFQYSIQKIFGMVYFPDEFGYWASAAKWIGYDWSSLTALGSYYSFGYSLLLAPILKLCTGGVTAYRAAVALNLLLQAVTIPMLYYIFKRLFPDVDELLSVCAVGIALFYPVWIFYGQVTLAEGFLFFLYIGIVFLMVRTVKKAGLGTILLLAVLLVYLCFVHMRTIGTAIAAVLVLLCWLWKEPVYRKRMLAGFGLLAAACILGTVLRLLVLDTVYGNTGQDMLARNDISGQLSRVQAICSAEGMVRFWCGCAGKLFYLGASSFGLVYYALAYTGRNSIRVWQKMRYGKRIMVQEWMSLFLFLSFWGQFLITAVYMNEPRRADEVVYGRYNDHLLPVYMGIGLIWMYRRRFTGKAVAAVMAVQSALLPVVIYGEELYGGSEIQGYFMAGISYLVDDLHFEAIQDLSGICLLSNLMILVFSGLIWVGKEKKLAVCTMAIAVLMEIILGLGLHHKYTYRFNELIYREVLFSLFLSQEPEREIFYLYEDGIAYIDEIQFNLPERKIRVIPEQAFQEALKSEDMEAIVELSRDETGRQGYLILDVDSICRDQIEQYGKMCTESAYFVLYDPLDFSD